MCCKSTSGQVLALARGETSVVEDDSRIRAFFLEVEFRDRIHAVFPHDHAPCLDDSLVWEQLDVASHDVAAETRKRATHFAADVRWSGALHIGEIGELGELAAVRKRFVYALAARFDDDLLMDGFRGVRNLLGGDTLCRRGGRAEDASGAAKHWKQGSQAQGEVSAGKELRSHELFLFLSNEVKSVVSGRLQ